MDLELRNTQIMATRVHLGEIDYLNGMLHALGRIDLADAVNACQGMQRSFEDAFHRWLVESGADKASLLDDCIQPPPIELDMQQEALQAAEEEVMRQIECALLEFDAMGLVASEMEMSDNDLLELLQHRMNDLEAQLESPSAVPYKDLKADVQKTERWCRKVEKAIDRRAFRAGRQSSS